MQRPIFWPVLGWIGSTLLVLGAIWAFGGYRDLGLLGAFVLTLGIALAMAVSIGLMSIIVYGRRSRRDEAVQRAARHDR